jgi:hypothetical protein
MVSWFGPQNHVGYALSVAPQNRWEDEDGAGHALRYSVLLRLEVSQARVSQSCLKTGGGATQMVHVVSLRRSCGDEVEDGRVDMTGCIRLLYPNLAFFVVLGHKGSLVINFPINRTPMASGEASNSAIPLPPHSHSCFLRGVGVLHGVSEEISESERSLQSSKQWEDVVPVSTSCRHLILSI